MQSLDYLFNGKEPAALFVLVMYRVYPKKYADGFCFAVLCCGYTLTDFPISIMLTSLALWQSNDCPSASKATLMNMDKYFMWIHCEWLHNHNKAKHNKTVCIFLGIYCRCDLCNPGPWFNIKMSYYQYRKSHCGDKTVVRLSYLHNGNLYTGKMIPLYWISPQVHDSCK